MKKGGIIVDERISVITLSFNNLEYYEECLKSVTEQTYQNIEWILCDDGSENFEYNEKNIKTYLKEHGGNVRNIIIHHNEKNMGVVKNYEQAIKMATGEYIFYLAIDDMFYDNNVLSDVVKYFKETNYEIFGGYWEMFYEDGRKQKQPSNSQVMLLKNESLKKVFQRFIRIPMVVGSCTPFKKELIEKYGFVDEGYKHLEDWPRYLNLMKNGVKIGFIDRCLIKYRSGGITTEIENKDLILDYKRLLGEYMNPPYSYILNAMKEKKYIIAWGCSGGFLMYYKEWESLVDRRIDLIVDKNQEKWGSMIDGREIFSPAKIREMDSNEIYVLVFSWVYYLEIAEELENMGFVEGKHFDLISREVLVWQNKL